MSEQTKNPKPDEQRMCSKRMQNNCDELMKKTVVENLKIRQKKDIKRKFSFGLKVANLFSCTCAAQQDESQEDRYS